MKEYTVKKPRSIAGYPVHRAVAALTQGAPHLWRDNGETLTIRTTAPLDTEGVDLPSVQAGELRLFKLRACVASKVRGRHVYPARGDHIHLAVVLKLLTGERIVDIHSKSAEIAIALAGCGNRHDRAAGTYA